MGLRKGMRFEQQARRYLQRNGLQLLEQNFRSRFGEIDLIMRDRACICFIEVKYRASPDFGGAYASIPLYKQRKLIKTALYYLACHPQYANRDLRFDALLIQRQRDGAEQIEWIPNAFYAE